MSEGISQPAKPGTACLGCRRRKLKCSREQEGCANCLRSDLPCVYPTPETGVKRKRGPYKKDKAPRERHLEDLVKYLEPRADAAGRQSDTIHGQTPVKGAEGSTGRSYPGSNHRPSRSGVQPPKFESQYRSHAKPADSEDLVKDALIALTKSSVNDVEAQEDIPKHATQPARNAVRVDASLSDTHPSARRMFEYWDLFVHRVDPLVKILHCPGFTKNLFHAIDRPGELGVGTHTLLLGVYFAAVTSCTPREARVRFGESRSVLLERYGKTIEASVSNSYDVPTLELLQALVLYLISVRRDDGDVNVRALFSLTVRMAQLIGLQEDPGDDYPPFETEMRRRLWWQICGLESMAAEEGVARQTSIMEERNVRVPSNLSDIDLQPDMQEKPISRSGVAETSFLILRTEVMLLAHRLWAIKKRFRLEGRIEETGAILQDQRAALEVFKAKMREDLLQHCDTSRRFDWLLIAFYEAMSVKMRMIVEHPTTQIPTASMSASARLDLLQSSVQLINNTLGISKSENLRDWGWYFRGYMQWHSVAVVIAELGRSTNAAFANYAWAVLDPVLKTWDETFKGKRGEDAWEHVNALIERAREMRRKNLLSQRSQVAESARSYGEGEQQVERPTGMYPQAPPTAWPPSQPAGSNTLNTTWSSNPNTPQIQQPPHPPAETFTTGCATHMPGLEDTTFGLSEFDSLENIDFSAFDAVFGDTTWDSSPSMDFAWDAPVT